MYYFQLNSQDNDKIADWVELHVIYNNIEYNKSQLANDIDQTGIELTEGDIDSVFSILSNRLRLYGASCPYRFDLGIMTPVKNWRDIPEYVSCLLFSIYGNQFVDSATENGKIFERISVQAFQNFFDGKGYVFGFPSHTNLEEFCAIINEKFIRNFPPKTKDGKLDLVITKKIDERAGQLIACVQCASGKNWFHKLNELSIHYLKSHIDFVASPIKAFAMPVLIDHPDKMEDITKRADGSIIFDRARIYQYISLTCDEDLKSDVISWCDTNMGKYVETAS